MPVTSKHNPALGRMTGVDAKPRDWVPGRGDLWGHGGGGDWAIAPAWRSSSEAIWRSGNAFIIRWNLLGDHGGGWTAGEGYESYDTYDRAIQAIVAYFRRFPSGVIHTWVYKKAAFDTRIRHLQKKLIDRMRFDFANTLRMNLDYYKNRVPEIEISGLLQMGFLIEDLNDIFASIVEELQGKPYKKGGNGPDAYDCSGTICYGIRETAKSNFGDYTADDLFSMYSKVSKSKNKGTLIFYDWEADGKIDHVVSILNTIEMLHPSSGAGYIQKKPLTYLSNCSQNQVTYYREIN